MPSVLHHPQEGFLGFIWERDRRRWRWKRSESSALHQWIPQTPASKYMVENSRCRWTCPADSQSSEVQTLFRWFLVMQQSGKVWCDYLSQLGLIISNQLDAAHTLPAPNTHIRTRETWTRVNWEMLFSIILGNPELEWHLIDSLSLIEQSVVATASKEGENN